MALSTNSIFKMTMTIRNLLGSSRYTSARLLQNSCIKLIAEEGTSNAIEHHPLNSKETPDIMMQKNEFKWCQSSLQVFELVNNSKSMSAVEAIGALQTLFKLDKNNNFPDDSIKQRKEFIALCEIINKDLRNLSERNIIDTLKVLLYFQIPVTSIIIQSLLQMIRHSLNNLSLEQITFIDFLLKKIKSKTPLVEALKMALPVVFNTHLKTKLDTENINSLTNALVYLTMENNTKALPFVLNALKKYSDFDTQQAMNILMGLFKIKSNRNNVEFIEKVQKIIAHNSDDVDPQRLSLVIRIIAMKLKDSEPYFYHEGLIESIVQTIIWKNMEVQLAVSILSNLNKIRFASTSLLDYIAAKCYEDKSIINKLTAHELLDILCAMSLADYKPIFWDSLKDLLLTEKIFELNHRTLTKTALFLASLDHYWPQLLDLIFNNENLHSRSSIKEILFKDQKNLLMLHSAVSVFFPEYTGPLLADDIVQIFRNVPLQKMDKYPLKSALELSLGGPQYIITHVTTDFAYHVDHVVIMKKGCPIAVSDEENFFVKLSDIKLIPDSQVLLFLYIQESFYVRNTQRLTGLQLLTIKLLKSKSNYTVIPVLADMWNSCSESERTRYISQAIKLKSDKLSASINF